MEKGSAAVADEIPPISDVKTTSIQTTFRPSNKRSGSDVIGSTAEEPVLAERSTKLYKNVQDEFQSCRRRSLDVVDCIGDKHGKVKCTDSMTEVDSAVGGSERPTTLDMNPTVGAEGNRDAQTWTSGDRSSAEVTDATPCTPPEPGDISETGSR
jgi:hypothetical protein